MTLRLYLHALRAARPRQLRGRAIRPIARRRFPREFPSAVTPLRGPVSLWRSAAFEPKALTGSGNERLRRFHEHYGEDVLALARAGKAGDALAAARAWIAANPPALGDPWHPYVTSSRAGNWIAALSLEPSLATAPVGASLRQQLEYVRRNVEDDVLGNHVVRNARALVLGGLALADDRLLERGRSLLARELPEQILPDGGHYERSPVYHAIVLRDLLEIAAADESAVQVELIERMHRFAASLMRPDGAPALFNDGSLDLWPRLELLPARDGLAVFAETGYAVVRRGDLWLAFDCGAPAPAFLPAHAHADALSFQLWWRGRPVVVDPGSYTYEAGPERDWFRGTRAHATVAVDGRDQFELWGAFRSGPLPQVELVGATAEAIVGRVVLDDVVHERHIELSGQGIRITDRLDGSGVHDVESNLPLADNAAVIVEAFGGLAVHEEERPFSESFYERRTGRAIVQRGRVALPVELGWVINAVPA